MPTGSCDILIELHVDDFAAAKAFYGMLGFEVAREEPLAGKAGYLVMRRGGNVLCFWPGNAAVYQQSYFQRFPADTPRGYGVEIVVMVEDVARLYEAVRDRLPVVGELRPRPWGARDFRLVDPCGYYLRITEPYRVL